MRAAWRTDADYDATRRWNGLAKAHSRRLHRRLVTVASDADVIEAVKLAPSRGLCISVRTGGRNWIAASLRDDGTLIDLSQLVWAWNE